MTDHHTDIVIVGGGLVGMTFACLMADANHRIVLLDRCHAPDPMPTATMGRVHAYNIASQHLLQSLDVWSRIPQIACAPFQRMQVTAFGQRPELTITAKDIAYPHLGHFIPSDVVRAALYEALKIRPNVHCIWQDTPIGLHNQHDGIILESRQHRVHAKILVGADGGRSWVRSQTPIRFRTHAYHQRCMVGYVDFEGDHQQTAWQRFLPTGPIGLLPLNQNRFSLAWSLDDKLAKTYQKLDDGAFLKLVFAQKLPPSIHALTQISQRKDFPLLALHAHQYAHDRTVLIGDAAHAIHPLAGLGLNLGLRDAQTLAVALQRHGMHHFRDAFDTYAQQRRPQNAVFMHGMTAFNSIFRHTNHLSQALQNLALTTPQYLPWLKRALGLYATHLDSDEIWCKTR